MNVNQFPTYLKSLDNAWKSVDKIYFFPRVQAQIKEEIFCFTASCLSREMLELRNYCYKNKCSNEEFCCITDGRARGDEKSDQQMFISRKVLSLTVDSKCYWAQRDLYKILCLMKQSHISYKHKPLIA